MRLLNEISYPTHLFARHLSKNATLCPRKVGENIVTNHLPKSIVFNRRRLCRKLWLMFQMGVLDDVNVDQHNLKTYFCVDIFVVH